MNTSCKISQCRTKIPCVLVYHFMQFVDWKRISQFLRLFEIINLNKSIFDLVKPDPFFIELSGNPVMRVTIKLKSERRPSWYTQITKPEIVVDKIEIIMKAAARIIFEKCFMALFVMPWFISCAGLHCRKNMNDSPMISSLRNYFFYFIRMSIKKFGHYKASIYYWPYQLPSYTALVN